MMFSSLLTNVLSTTEFYDENNKKRKQKRYVNVCFEGCTLFLVVVAKTEVKSLSYSEKSLLYCNCHGYNE